jgi:hypothetical protein
MANLSRIEIGEPGLPPRQLVLDRGIEVGRKCNGELLSDEGVSRRHLKLLPSPIGLSLVDLAAPMGRSTACGSSDGSHSSRET